MDGGMKSTAALNAMDAVVLEVSNPMTAAAAYYHNEANADCHQAEKPEATWENVMHTIGKVPNFYMQALTEYSLRAHGYDAHWGNISDNVS